MNRIDELLDAAVLDGGMEPPALSEAEIGRVCALAEKIRARGLHRRKIWLVAAAFAALLTACAAALSVSDVFDGVFREKKASGDYGAVEGKRALVDKTGTVLGQSITSDGITVTLEGLAGDSTMLNLILDVRRPDGTPCIWETPHGKMEQLNFDRAALIVEGDPHEGIDDTYLDAYPEPVDEDKDPGRIRYLIQAETQGLPLAGKQAALVLEEFGGEQFMLGEEIETTFTDMAALYALFPQVEDKDLIEEIPPDYAKYPEQKFHLPDAGVKIPLSPDLPGVNVVSAGFAHGVFEMALSCEGVESNDRMISRRLTLRDHEAGREYAENGWESCFAQEGDDMTPRSDLPAYMQPKAGNGYFYCRFPEVTDKAMLNGLHPYFTADMVKTTVSKGRWQFEFPLDYEDTTVERKVDFRAKYNGIPFHVTRLRYSPLSYAVEGTYQDITGEFRLHDNNFRISLRMRDGGEIVVNNGYRLKGGDDGVIMFHCTGAMHYVIDPDDVAGLIVGDTEFTLD